MGNETLRNAGKAKNDEFYTQLSDIEKECWHYQEHFKGKSVLCNCDDPRVSRFFYFFYMNFRALGLKRLIATCYKNLNPDLFSRNLDEQAVYCIYDGEGRVDDVFNDGDAFLKQNQWGVLKGDGDFHSPECIELLKQADIVCTNPPFSLFREYVAQLMEYDKKFLIIGNLNAITYKEIFKMIKDDKIWMGFNNGVKKFIVPRDYQHLTTTMGENGVRLTSMGNTCWYTNLDIKKRHEKLKLFRKYTTEKYPHYDNYDAIEVSKVTDIPEDWDGVMGVPITFLDKYNPEQFEIIGIDRYVEDNPHYGHRFKLDGKEVYARILTKRRK
jgi:hypothetical protein